MAEFSEMLSTYNWNQVQSFQSPYLRKQNALLAYLKTGKSFLAHRNNSICKKSWYVSMPPFFLFLSSAFERIRERSLVRNIHTFTTPVKKSNT